MHKRNLIAALTLTMSSTIIHADDSKTGFNPDISLILEGAYSSYSNTTDYELPGFMLGGEAGHREKGFYLGHTELSLSANIDDLFYGKFTAAIAEHEGGTEVELEEAFIQTNGLGMGFNLRAGRFFSDFGYLNNQHGHSWDFMNAPLVYVGMFGNQLIDDGLQLNWTAPTDTYLKLGVESLRGARYPAGNGEEGEGASTLFIKTGGDVGDSHAWQLGLSQWQANVAGRSASAHDHGGTATEIPSFSGNSRVQGIDLVWKWAPKGNATQTNLKIQAEYFVRDEEGTVEMLGSAPLESSSYLGKQSGWYLQTIYQFIPRWRIGLRYDQLQANNSGSDELILQEAGLDNEGLNPHRSTLMLDYSRSEYSRIRLQYSQDDSFEISNQIFSLQYTMSLGAHGAHAF